MAIRIKLSNKTIRSHSPFNVFIWDSVERPIRKLEITKALFEKRYNKTPYNSNQYDWSREKHIERIAWLVLHKARKPIEIDVGIPSMEFCPERLIQDGYHRLAAAYYRGDETIMASIAGDCKYAEKLFGLPKGSVAAQ
jgi:hypothetical protein